MDHHAIADVDSNVRRANGVIGFLKEDQVTRLCIRRRNITALSAQTVGCCTPNAPPIAAVIDDPANEAGAVKTGAWGTSAPHIRHVASIPLWIKTNLRRVAQRQSTVGLNSPSIFICCSFCGSKQSFPKSLLHITPRISRFLQSFQQINF